MTSSSQDSVVNVEEQTPQPEVASVESRPKEGWTWLYNTPKWHYFVDQESLCRRWILFSGGAFLEPNMRSNRIGYCKTCEKKLKAMRGS